MSDPTALPQKQMASSRKQKEPSTGEPAAENRILAGYLAHEFLTQGTLLGQRIIVPAATQSPSGADEAREEHVRAYADVAVLLKTDGAHIPGVINPTHLARWLQMPAGNLSLSRE